jgi:Tol biopolymer transport system component
VTHKDASHQEGSHRFPTWLPDGKHFLYTVRSTVREQSGVYAGSLDGKTKKPVIRGNMTFALYEPSGFLLFMSEAGLMGQAFDADRLEPRGRAFLVEADVGRSTLGYGPVTVTSGGTLAYARALAESGRLTWFDQSGNAQGSVGPPGFWQDFRLSHDQTRLAASLVDLKTGFPDIWLTDLALGNPAPFTYGPAINDAPLWSPNDMQIIFRTSRNGGLTEFFRKSAGGGGDEQVVLAEKVMRASGVSSPNLSLGDWSPDGQYLIFSAGAQADLWLLRTDDRKPMKFGAAPGQKLHSSISPDGHWVAYSSNASGQFEIKVQRFPLPVGESTVSIAGGYEPRWGADGHELYYLSLDKKLMSVTVNPEPPFGVPKQLFQTHVPGGINGFRRHYVPSRDGKRFLINTQTGDPAPVSITVMLNWTAGLKK